MFGNVNLNAQVLRLGATAGVIGIGIGPTTLVYVSCRDVWFGELTDKWWLRGHEIRW